MESQFTQITFPLEEFNHGAQLVAIGGLLARQERADQELAGEIKEADEVARRTEGRANDHAVDVYVELAEMSCYQDAAHSMAAVGMIAPFIESFFRAYFRSIGKELPDRHLVKNILKRIEEVGMEEYMPPDLKATLSALFEYRNNMFHGGFEWSLERLKRFQAQLSENRWPSDWFSWATFDDEPWMCYMTSDFIAHCLDMAEGVTKGIEEYATRGLPDLPQSDLTNSIWRLAP